MSATTVFRGKMFRVMMSKIGPLPRRDGRVAEGGGLLNRYTAKSGIGGSNPPLSAILYPPS